MSWFIIAILIALVAITLIVVGKVKDSYNDEWILRPWGFLILGIAILLLIPAAAYTQDPGQANVIRSFSGKVSGVDTSAGLGFKAPWDSTIPFDIRNQRLEMHTNKGGQGPDGAAIDLGLKGGANASISLTVRYSIEPGSVRTIYEEFKNEGNLLDREMRPAARDAARDAGTTFEPFTIKEERVRLATAIEDALRDRWNRYGIVVEGVDVGNPVLDDETEKAIEQVNASRQQVEAARNGLDAARIEAETTKVEAQADADSDQIIRCGATSEQVTEEVAGKEVTSTKVVPKEGNACEERLNEQVLRAKELEALRDIGSNGNMVVVDLGEGSATPLINLPQPQPGG